MNRERVMYMKHHFFISQIPIMAVIGFFVIFLSNQYDGKAKMLHFSMEQKDLGTYSGEYMKEEGTKGNEVYNQEKLYNGTQLKENGLPYCIKVNKKLNVVTIYKVGKDGYYSVPIKAMVCSVGKTGNTPEGVFNLGSREKWLYLEGDVYGQYATSIVGDILFHSVPYFSQNKDDLEIEEYNKLGNSVSAGCVRLSVIDAKWIYDNCREMTYVEIFQSDYKGPLGKPVSAVVSSGANVGNWDPTDPDRENPYIGNVPVILGAYDREIERYTDFDITAGVTALDSHGNDITSDLKVDGEVDASVCGIYQVSYSIRDRIGLEDHVTANFIIKDEKPPVLIVDQIVDKIGTYDIAKESELRELLLKNVVAYDGNKQLEDDAVSVDYSEVIEKGYGDCKVKYQAKDSEGNLSEVVSLTVCVDMKAPEIILKNENQGAIRISNMLNDEYLRNLVEVKDNSGSANLTVSKPLKYVVNHPYIVVFCAKDEFGNVSTMSVTYKVKE